MRRVLALRPALVLLSGLALCAPGPAQALSMGDPLTAWKSGSAMDRMQLATRFGKSFHTLNESFTAGYFLKCIDDIAGYTNAEKAKIEDAMRECVASQLRLTGQGDD